VRSSSAAPVVSAIAILAYLVVTFVALWMVAHAYSRDTGADLDPVGMTLLALVLPFAVGFAVGNWWVGVLAGWLVLATSAAEALEPINSSGSGEMEPNVFLVGLVLGVAHVPLLLTGAGLRQALLPARPEEP
jgi:hypothetical protein